MNLQKYCFFVMALNNVSEQLLVIAVKASTMWLLAVDLLHITVNNCNLYD